MIEGLEDVGEDYYKRTVNVNGSKGWFKATLAKENRLDIEFELDDISQLRSLIANIRRMFDLDVDIAKVEAFLRLLILPWWLRVVSVFLACGVLGRQA